MNLGITMSLGRCGVVWGAVSATAAGVLAAVLPEAVAAPGAGFDLVLVWGCSVVAAATTCWLWTVATVVAVDAARGRWAVRRGVPAGLRRALLVLCGAAVAGGLAGPAVAGGTGPTEPSVLAGLRLPERVAVTPAPVVQAISPPWRHPVVVVVPGDTLWDIAARRLGAATSWPAIYALNRDLIGSDPGAITPGQRLILPVTPDGGAR